LTQVKILVPDAPPLKSKSGTTYPTNKKCLSNVCRCQQSLPLRSEKSIVFANGAGLNLQTNPLLFLRETGEVNGWIADAGSLSA